MTKITSKNPKNGKDIKEYKLLTIDQLDAKIDRAYTVQKSWRKTSFAERSKLMHKAADMLRKNKDKYAQHITDEMGKLYSSAQDEIEKCAWVCEYYADHAKQHLADELLESDASRSMISYAPLGVVLAVMPWNYPFWQVLRFAAPALMAGNAGMLKHASNVPQCALDIEEVFEQAGFPAGLFTTLLIDTDEVEGIIQDSRVVACTLTGSEGAGRAVAETAGSELKKCVLELGGSDPYIILEDADLDHAVEQCVTSRLLNSGQSCIGAKRFIVLEQVYDEFLEKFTDAMSSKTIGDPYESDTDVSPMARIDLRDELHQQVRDTVDAGATLQLGGFIPDRDGAYYPPTILTDIPEGTPGYEEELFGPVASVFKVSDENEAIALANDSDFGLGGAVFTRDVERGERIAREELEAGCCFVNHYVKSDPRLPFGGIKNSGYGRELSHLGIREFCNIKTVYIK